MDFNSFSFVFNRSKLLLLFSSSNNLISDSRDAIRLFSVLFSEDEIAIVLLLISSKRISKNSWGFIVSWRSLCSMFSIFTGL